MIEISVTEADEDRRLREDIDAQLITAERQLSNVIGESLRRHGSVHPATRAAQRAYDLVRDAKLFNAVAIDD